MASPDKPTPTERRWSPAFLLAWVNMLLHLGRRQTRESASSYYPQDSSLRLRRPQAGDQRHTHGGGAGANTDYHGGPDY